MLKILLTTAALSLATSALAQMAEPQHHDDSAPPAAHTTLPPPAEHHTAPPAEHHTSPPAHRMAPGDEHRAPEHLMGGDERHHMDHPRRVEHCHGPFWHRVCEHDHWHH